MKKYQKIAAVFFIALLSHSFIPKEKITRIYLIGDSTMMDYETYREDYLTSLYPLTGWGQVFQPLFNRATISSLDFLIHSDSVLVVNHAMGGRSSRTFFEERRWEKVYEELRPGDLVLIQFGHNDATEERPLRFVTPEAYKEYIRMYVSQTRMKGAIPIVITPVSRNFPWKDGQLENLHGAYYTAALEIAGETSALLIDLTKRSMELFAAKGEEYVTSHYFMNMKPGEFENYPEGKEDNTHFKTEGAEVVAQLVLEGLQQLRSNPAR